VKKLALATVAAAALGTAATASAGPVVHDCDEFLCTGNGPQLTGMALPSVKAKQPIVTAVTLPSGETVVLRWPHATQSKEVRVKKLALATVAAAALAAASTAGAVQTANGPQRTGLALPTVKAQQPIVNAVTLPSGETIDLR